MKRKWHWVVSAVLLCSLFIPGNRVFADTEENIVGTEGEQAIPEMTDEMLTVIGSDENGNIFEIDDDESGIVTEGQTNSKARSASVQIVNFCANAAGTEVNDVTTYTEYLTGNSGYVYGKSAADAAYLGTENGKVKFMQSGVVGLVDASKVQVVNLSSVKSYSNYYANGSRIIHRISTNMTTSGYGSSVDVGPQQSYMKTGTTYYSYDGHYFYTDYSVMLSDYKNDTRKNSVNPDNPYYNYFQYLPLRGLSNYSSSELQAMINAKVSSTSSKMYNTGSAFSSNQNTYGVNALIMACVGATESGWGSSSISQKKNNLFGINAVDGSSGDSANTFSSVSDCIRRFAETYMSKRYLRAGYTYYHGGYLGDKASGINVSYASNPYWGEIIAGVAWNLDNNNGKKDQFQYTIGIKDTIATKHTTLNVRKEASTGSTALYSTGNVSNYAFLIKGESNGFYQIQSDPVLTNGRTAIDTGSGKYNAASMYAYTSKDYVTVVSNGKTSGSGEDNGSSSEEVKGVQYRTHVQSYGWMSEKENGNTAGTEGEAKRMEAIAISLENMEYSGSVEYQAHVQSYGWMDWKSDGETAGTEGEAKRMEAVKIRLSGEIADYYDIYYRVHSQTYGWLDWAKNGEIAGTTDGAKRMEAIQIILKKKDEAAPGETQQAYVQPLIEYQTHIQTYGWQEYLLGGGFSGTEGEAKRLEAVRIQLLNQKYTGSIQYRTHVQSKGWLGWVSNNGLSGTTGEAKRMEAIQIKLTGRMAECYDVYYRVHSQTYGWLDWAKNGETAGTTGLAKRMESLQVILVSKGSEAPGETARPYIEVK